MSFSVIDQPSDTLRATVDSFEAGALSHVQLDSILQAMADGALVASTDGRIRFSNSAIRRLLGRSKAELAGRPVAELLGFSAHDMVKLERQLDQRGFQTGQMIALRDCQNRSLPAMLAAARLLRPDGASDGVLYMLQDVTALKRAEAKIRSLADFDNLTGLPNRRRFREQVELALAQAEQQQTQFAILFLDLDDFKRINDTLGHDAGDQLLQLVAERLRTSLRKDDEIGRRSAANGAVQAAPGSDVESTVARPGGDEFTLLLADVKNADDAAAVAARLLASMTEPVELVGHQVYVTLSVGIAVYPGDGEDPDTLFRNADVAMYQAKRQGKSSYRFYDPSMNAQAARRLQLEQALRDALANNEFSLVYQPQLNLITETVVGVEALLRWYSPQLGFIPPGDFIPVAETTGLIVPIGFWVLRAACEQAQRWQRQGLPVLRMAVNISARQFAQPDLPEQVAAILKETGLDAQYLELELTESLLMQDVEQAIQTMDQLKALGVQLAIDDFGTGYSSLSYLKRFPIDRLKIDRAFVHDINADPDNAAIALAVIAMAHNLKLSVIAEGVETHAQQAFLAHQQCDEIQGYLLSKPLLPDDLAALLRRCQSETLRYDEGEKKSRSGRRTVLLVDDEPKLTTALGRLLTRNGYRVITAASAHEALALLATNEVRVIITDYAMPGMKGTQLLKRVRELYPRVMRILLSGQISTEILAAAINDGAVVKFLAKPVSEVELLTTLQHALRSADAALQSP